MSARPASLGRLLAFGGPIFGLGYLLFFVQFYFLNFATDVLLMSPAIVGGLFAAAKLWDAVSDPLVGSISDRARWRLGRRRPFLLAALPLLALGFLPLWWVPAALDGALLVVWIALALFVFYTGFTFYTLPHVALGAELSRDSHERTRLFAARQMSFTVGMLLAFAAIQLALTAEAPRAMAVRIAVPTLLLALVALAVTPLAVREPVAADRRGGRGLVPAIRDVAANRPARLLLVVWLVESIGVGAVGTMGPYFAKYVLERPDVVGVLSGAYVVAAVASMPLWVRVARSAGRRRTWLVGMSTASAAFGAMLLFGEGDVLPVLALLALAGGAMGCGQVMSPSVLADVIDADERSTGERKEGVYSAAMNFMLKVGTSLALAVSGPILSLLGFEPNVEQSDAGRWAIQLLFAGMPCVGFLLGALIFRRVPLESAPSGRAPAPARDASDPV